MIRSKFNKCLLSSFVLLLQCQTFAWADDTPDSNSAAPDTAASSPADDAKYGGDLSKIENKLYSHDFGSESASTRLDRIERLIYGSAKTGSMDERMKELLTDVHMLPNQPPPSAPGPVAPAPYQQSAAPSQSVDQGQFAPAYPSANQQQQTAYPPANYTTQNQQPQYPPSYPQSPEYPPEVQPAQIGQQTYDSQPNQATYPPPTQPQYPPANQQASYPPTYQQSQYPPADQQAQYPPPTQQAQYPPTGQQSQYTSQVQPTQISQQSIYPPQNQADANYQQGMATLNSLANGYTMGNPAAAQQQPQPAIKGPKAPSSLKAEITVMEQRVFGQTYDKDTLTNRVTRLEQSVFSQHPPKHFSSLPKRVDQLMAAVQPSSFSTPQNMYSGTSVLASSNASNQPEEQKQNNGHPYLKKLGATLGRAALTAGSVAGGVAIGNMMSGGSMMGGYGGYGYGGYGNYGGYGLSRMGGLTNFRF